MKLLICAQAIDCTDPTLGFFHTWVARLAEKYERITVFALRVGEHALPKNVEVVYLGDNRFTRIWRVMNESRKRRDQYDAVFVHMSQEFVLLAGWLWRRFKKNVYLWRNHYAGSSATDRAAHTCTKVFYTSKFSYTAKYPHAVKMPVGVDTEHFKRSTQIDRDPRGVLFLGRITPSKRPHMLLEALGLLKARGMAFTALICGAKALIDHSYISKLEELIKKHNLQDSVDMRDGVPVKDTPALFSRHAVFVNCSPSGMYDKTLFEAASSECIVLASSKDFAELVPQEFIFEDGSVEDLARKLEYVLKLPLLDQQGKGAQLHNVAREHSLSNLVERLVQEMA